MKLKSSVLTGVITIGMLGVGHSIIKKDVTLVVDGKESTVSTYKSNVEEFLRENNVKYDKDDIINLSLDKKLEDDLKVEVTDVREEIQREYKKIPFDVQIVEDENLLKGKTEIKTEGKEGENELVYKVIFHNGKQVKRNFVKEKLVTRPVDKVIKKGTKVEIKEEAKEKVAISRGESTRNLVKKDNSDKTQKRKVVSKSRSNISGKKITVQATAYTGHSITSTGTIPKWGTIAVDPSVIPYGTRVYIPQLNKTFIAEDCGGAIKGNKIDIFMNDEGSVYNWGRKTIDVYIVG